MIKISKSLSFNDNRQGEKERDTCSDLEWSTTKETDLVTGVKGGVENGSVGHEKIESNVLLGRFFG